MNAHADRRHEALGDIAAARAALNSILDRLAAYEDRVIDPSIPYRLLPTPEIRDLARQCQALTGDQ